jgi:hypothetical protein
MSARLPWFGCFLVFAGLFGLWFGGSIRESGVSGGHDIGPRAFPFGLSILLLAGGIIDLATAIFPGGKRAAGNAGALSTSQTNAARSSHARVLIFLGALLVYVFALPWLGFNLATFLFSMGMLFLLRARWLAAMGFTLSILLLIHLLFVLLFKIQLPRSQLGIPF